MSHSGTVVCGYCGEEGHNRRGCPARKKRVEALRAAGDNNNYLVAEQRGFDAATNLRKCSYCGEYDHNIRTCPDPARDWEYLASADATWRAKVVDSYREKYPGLGTGAIVSQIDVKYSFESGEYTPLETVYRLDSVDSEYFYTLIDNGGHMYDSFLRGHVISCSSLGPNVDPALLKKSGEVSQLLSPSLPGATPRYRTFDHFGDTVLRYPNLGKMGDIQVLSPASHKAVNFMWDDFANHKLERGEFRASHARNRGPTYRPGSKDWNLELLRVIGRIRSMLLAQKTSDCPWHYLRDAHGLPGLP